MYDVTTTERIDFSYASVFDWCIELLHAATVPGKRPRTQLSARAFHALPTICFLHQEMRNLINFLGITAYPRKLDTP